MADSEFVEKRSLSSFVNSLTESMRIEFYHMIGPNIEVNTEKMIQPYEIHIKHKAFLGRFHRHFAEKVICNLQNKDWHVSGSKLIKFASIFPFEIKSQIEEEIDLEIYGILNSEFENLVKEFLERHFDDVNQVSELVKLFFKNIYLFQTSINSTHQHETTEPSSSKGRNMSQHILDNVPRLTENGIKCYLWQYSLTRKVMQKFSPAQEKTINFDEYDEAYFRNLPETNFTQLRSLLDVDFYKQNSSRYMQLFEKYLFFFQHALCLGYTPLCFIDDLLFDCLKELHFYVKSRDNPINLKPQIANHACVYQRADIDLIRENDLVVSDRSLDQIKNFLEKGIRNITKAVLRNNIETAPLGGHVFACTDREVFDVCFSWHLKDDVSFFIKYIIFSALSPQVFNRLCIYNLYTGIKTWMFTPSVNRDSVLEFVNKYYSFNENFKKLYPKDFITPGFERYYEVYCT